MKILRRPTRFGMQKTRVTFEKEKFKLKKKQQRCLLRAIY